MESQINHIVSPYFDKKKFHTQIDIIKKASEIAQNKIDYYYAHDEEILHAIEIVEKYLKKKHRICYGGQAINAYLPVKYKFYDPNTSIPDYDFFTPSQNEDIVVLVKDLKKAGFTEIAARQGMHEGTIRIYVNFTPVADMTEIDPILYNILSKRKSTIDEISYLDANTLRMLMYLELSRPRGEIERWNKVFERLLLFNEFVHIKRCPGFNHSTMLFNNMLTNEQVDITLEYIIMNKRVFAGADLLPFYKNALKDRKHATEWIFGSRKPILFYSADSSLDATQLISKLTHIPHHTTRYAKSKAFTIQSYSSRGVDLLPSMKVIKQGKIPLIFIIDQTACHSYFNVPINNVQYNSMLRIASMDTLITLYFCLGLMKTSFFDIDSMQCLANELVQLSIKARSLPEQFIFPFISIKCYGHQKSFSSLIRAKVHRTAKKKQEIIHALNKHYSNRLNPKRRNTIRYKH